MVNEPIIARDDGSLQIAGGAAVAVAASATLTISSLSWATPDQAVKAGGVVMDAGDAGDLAVRRYGRTLKKLANS